MKHALITINHTKDAWQQLAQAEQDAFIKQMQQTAERMDVHLLLGYRLNTPHSVLDVWEAAAQSTLDEFKQALDALGYKKYFDYVAMYGERGDDWLQR